MHQVHPRSGHPKGQALSAAAVSTGQQRRSPARHRKVEDSPHAQRLGRCARRRAEHVQPGVGSVGGRIQRGVHAVLTNASSVFELPRVFSGGDPTQRLRPSGWVCRRRPGRSHDADRPGESMRSVGLGLASAERLEDQIRNRLLRADIPILGAEQREAPTVSVDGVPVGPGTLRCAHCRYEVPRLRSRLASFRLTDQPRLRRSPPRPRASLGACPPCSE